MRNPPEHVVIDHITGWSCRIVLTGEGVVMNALEVPLAAVGEFGLRIDETVPGEDLKPPGVNEFPIGPVSVEGMLSPSGHEYIFVGSVSGSFTAQCDRCLELTTQAFFSAVTWTFAHGAQQPATGTVDSDDVDEDLFEELVDDTVIPFDGPSINLLPAVWEEVVLAVPAKVLCKTDCAGLCPRCGANWNEGRCACGVVDDERGLSNKGFAGLKDMLPGLKPDRPEE